MVDVIMAGLYALWLVAGTLDFHFHRRTDLPRTSGMAESLLHGVQLGLIGGGVLAWLGMDNTRGLAACLGVVVLIHAVTGYLDTLSADGRRRISPAEQHVHSVLDTAPFILFAWVAWTAEKSWTLRWEPARAGIWAGVIVPALVIVVLPWIYEMTSTLASARRAGR